MGNKKYEYGEIKEYKKGDVVVWRGQQKCIGKIIGKSIGRFSNGCWAIDEKHDSLHYSNLRYATPEEREKLGKRQKLLIIDQK